MFHVLLTLDRRLDVGVRFGVNETLEAVLLGEAIRNAFRMFPFTAGEVTGHAGQVFSPRMTGWGAA